MTTAHSPFERTPADVAAEILMTRSAFQGAILLVEGPSDSRFIQRYILDATTQISICGGKETVLGAIDRIAGFSIGGCLAIIDRDFDDYQILSASQNVFYIDTHDTETLLLSRRLDTVVAELGEAVKISAFEQSNGCSIAEALLNRAAIFTNLRFLNDVHPRFCVGMKRYSPWRYTDHPTWVVDETRLHHDFAAEYGVTHPDLIAMIKGLPNLRSWSGVRGHDALVILSIGLRQALGDAGQISEAQLASSLRLAFSEDDFLQTNLYSMLAQWETSTGLPLLIH